MDERALALRYEWMRLVGFSEPDIESACVADPPVSVDIESGWLASAKDLGINSRSWAAIEKWVNQHPPPAGWLDDDDLGDNDEQASDSDRQ